MSSSKNHIPTNPTHKTLIWFLLISSIAGSPVLPDFPTAYQLLEKFEFPKGILPEGAQSYLLRPDGSFEVFLAGDCEFKVQDYTLRYRRRITGAVEVGHLKDLKGVSVKVLFFWIGISKVVRNGDELEFYVGPISASFLLSIFDESPRCGCGFDCSALMVSDA